MVQRRTAVFCGATLVASLPVLAAPSVSAQVAELLPLIDPKQPHFNLTQPLLLYLALPLVFLSSLVALLAPGYLLVASLGPRRPLGPQLLLGFAVSLLGLNFLSFSLQAVAGAYVEASTFSVVMLVWLAIACGAALLKSPNLPDARQYVDELGPIAITVVVLLLALTPKFYWQSFNGDGAHAFEAVRLVSHHLVPFWPEGAGAISGHPGKNSWLYTFSASWFVRLFGEREAGVRLPFFLHLVLLHAAMLSVIEYVRVRPLSRFGHWALAAGLASYTLISAYSTTYNAYAADIAMPGMQDTLLLACYVASIYFFMQRDWNACAVFVFCAMVTSPGAVPMLGAWGAAVFLGHRDRPWRTVLKFFGLVFAVLVAIAVIPKLLAAFGLASPGTEHSMGNDIKKFLRVAPFDVRRLLFVLVPFGIYPFAALIRYKSAPDAARALMLCCAATFFVYYPLAQVSLHYFVASMVLPPLFFWSFCDPDTTAKPMLARAGVVVGLVLACLVALPSSLELFTATRTIGGAVDVRAVPGYDSAEAGALGASDVLGTLFHLTGDHAVPELYGGSPLAWNYYAHQAPSEANYRVLGRAEMSPEGWKKQGTVGEWSTHVRSESSWNEHRQLRPPIHTGSYFYSIARPTLFGWEENSKVLKVIAIDYHLRKLLGR